MNFNYYGFRELVVLVSALEYALVEAYEELGMSRSDAQSRALAVIHEAV